MPTIEVEDRFYERLKKLAGQAGRTPDEMLPFVLEDGFELCEEEVRRTGKALEEARTEQFVAWGEIVASTECTVQSLRKQSDPLKKSSAA